ncbi:MAG: CDP-alcohol phosphatidyltransferase family protein [Sphingorhabdus sp.]
MDAPKRIQENLTAGVERHILDWLCARLPLWWTPDRLTALGFFGAVLIAAGYILSNWSPNWLWLAVFGFCLNWFGDSLDGSVARFRKIERPNYGYFIDHSLDALANTIFILGMGLSPYMRMDAALLGLAGYLLLSIHTFISAKIFGVMNLTYLGGGPTEVRMMLIVLTICMYIFGPEAWIHWPVARQMFSPFDIFAVALGSLLGGVFIFHTIRRGAELFHKGG